MSIRLLLALTGAIACAMLMARVFLFGNGIPGATLPAFLIGEAAWIGSLVICAVIFHEDRKKRVPKPSDAFVVLALFAMLAMQIVIPIKLLRDFGASIAG